MREADMPGNELLLCLLEVLEALRQRTQSFAELLGRERQAINTFAIDQLTSVNEAKLHLLEELSLHEDRRTDVIEQLAAMWNVPADSMTIGDIADRTGGPVADRLKRQQAQLNHTILAARRSNQVTGALLQKSLAFLHEAVSIVRAPFQAQLSLYSESGSMHPPALEGGLLERRG